MEGELANPLGETDDSGGVVLVEAGATWLIGMLKRSTNAYAPWGEVKKAFAWPNQIYKDLGILS